MVTKKPVGPPILTSDASQQKQKPASSSGPPPYPTTPTLDQAPTRASTASVYSPDLNDSMAFDLIDMHEAQQRMRSDSDASSHGTWDSDDEEQNEGTPEDIEVPKPLNVRASQNWEDRKEELPAVLRPGPAGGAKPRKSSETQRYDDEAHGNPWVDVERPERSSGNGTAQLESNNPYLRQNSFGGDNSQSAWQETRPTPPPQPAAAPPPPPTNAPPPPPPIQAPEGKFSEMSLNEERPASWETVEKLPVPQQGQPPFAPVVQNQAEDKPLQNRPLSRWWQDAIPEQQEQLPEVVVPPQVPTNAPPKAPNGKQPEPHYEPPSGPPPTRQAGGLIELEEPPTQPPRKAPAVISTSLPPSSHSPAPAPETPQTKLRRQRNEHYQIKHVNWYDESCKSNPQTRSGMRPSPILTQNANGPCPLLALVNALVLSTPSHLDTALVEALRSREQVSLGLLLDAVFDELTSGRRGDTTRQLPDVSELYTFLLALHTGMNVNPCFTTPATTPRGSFDSSPANLNSIHPLKRAQSKAGVFEETQEMRLYSTFNIPLIHGWVPSPDSPAYDACARSAQTFEDAQNIQFAETELNEKLAFEGLSFQEQQTLQDIQTIKAFLTTWPTQLTDHGLETISNSLQPGQVAILFRNDHFSTLYKEPVHGALMTLVTDAGYSTHDEIVWESLVDVNGSASELFSGDFRVVSHNQDARLNQGNSAGGADGWQTVPSRNQNRDNRPSNSGAAKETPPPLPGRRPKPHQESQDGTASELGIPPQSEAQRKAAEQEDHDLALALQLQEEEEDQHRQAEQRRRREQELSEQYLSNESTTNEPRPPIPPRRPVRGGAGPHHHHHHGRSPSGRTPAASSRPPVNRPSDSTNDPEAPPSYEQAASDPPYRPAGATATPEQGNPLGAYDALRRQQGQQSAYAQQSTANMNAADITGDTPPGYTNGGGRRRSETNRIRRRSSQFGVVASGSNQPIPPGGLPPAVAQQQRIGQAAGVKEAEDKCRVM